MHHRKGRPTRPYPGTVRIALQAVPGRRTSLRRHARPHRTGPAVPCTWPRSPPTRWRPRPPNRRPTRRPCATRGTASRTTEGRGSPGKQMFTRTLSGPGRGRPGGSRRRRRGRSWPPLWAVVRSSYRRCAAVRRRVVDGGRGAGRRVTQCSRSASIPGCVLCVIRHRVESAPRSGTLRGMRVVLEPDDPGLACAAAPVRGEGPCRRCAGPAREAILAVSARSCSTPRSVRRTVCTTHTPSRWNMPEALVAVTVRQPCCRVRESRSVTLRRREAMCPPVRMV